MMAWAQALWVCASVWLVCCTALTTENVFMDKFEEGQWLWIAGCGKSSFIDDAVEGEKSYYCYNGIHDREVIMDVQPIHSSVPYSFSFLEFYVKGLSNEPKVNITVHFDTNPQTSATVVVGPPYMSAPISNEWRHFRLSLSELRSQDTANLLYFTIYATSLPVELQLDSVRLTSSANAQRKSARSLVLEEKQSHKPSGIVAGAIGTVVIVSALIALTIFAKVKKALPKSPSHKPVSNTAQEERETGNESPLPTSRSLPDLPSASNSNSPFASPNNSPAPTRPPLTLAPIPPASASPKVPSPKSPSPRPPSGAPPSHAHPPPSHPHPPLSPPPSHAHPHPPPGQPPAHLHPPPSHPSTPKGERVPTSPPFPPPPYVPLSPVPSRPPPPPPGVNTPPLPPKVVRSQIGGARMTPLHSSAPELTNGGGDDDDDNYDTVRFNEVEEEEEDYETVRRNATTREDKEKREVGAALSLTNLFIPPPPKPEIHEPPPSMEVDLQLVAPIVRDACHYLSLKGLKEEGILRLAGSSAEVARLQTAYKTGESVNFDTCSDINSVADLLKRHLRGLPEPLIPTSNVSAFQEALKYPESDRVIHLKYALQTQSLPKDKVMTMKVLFEFLHLVMQYSSINKMSSANLAMVFAPTLRMPSDLVDSLVKYGDQVFVL